MRNQKNNIFNIIFLFLIKSAFNAATVKPKFSINRRVQFFYLSEALEFCFSLLDWRAGTVFKKIRDSKTILQANFNYSNK